MQYDNNVLSLLIDDLTIVHACNNKNLLKFYEIILKFEKVFIRYYDIVNVLGKQIIV